MHHKQPTFLNYLLEFLLYRRPSAEAVHETEHDVSNEFLEIAKLTHRLVLVLNGEMSHLQLMAILELKNRPHFATNYLDPAIKDGLIEMTIPKKAKI